MAQIERDALPDAAQDILGVLEQRNEWATRAELADALGKNQLTHADLTHLEYLETLGFIDTERPRGQVSYRYRVRSS